MVELNFERYCKAMTPEERKDYDARVEKMLRERHFRRANSMKNYAETVQKLAGFARRMGECYREMLEDGVFPRPDNTPFHKQNAVPAGLRQIADAGAEIIKGINIATAEDIKAFGETDGPPVITAASEELRRAAEDLHALNGVFHFAAPPSKPLRRARRTTRISALVTYAGIIREIAESLKTINRYYIGMRWCGLFPDIESTPFHGHGSIPQGYAKIVEANEEILAGLRGKKTEISEYAHTLKTANALLRKEVRYMPDLNPFRRKAEEAGREWPPKKAGTGK